MKRKTCFSPPVTVELGERNEGAREKRAEQEWGGWEVQGFNSVCPYFAVYLTVLPSWISQREVAVSYAFLSDDAIL